ncbi:MAG TPA: NADH-quinone oxidoreductase subunit J [Clostridia bacterium]|nr:NADH-quinone oxidoreductase subunit J [Clostridia bacterium]
MTLAFAVLAFFTIASAVAAVTLRNLVHCTLAVSVSFAGLAGLYLQLNAQFVGFAQVLVYVGAVAILVIFAVLMTRSDRRAAFGPKPGLVTSIVIAAAVFATTTVAVLKSGALPAETVTASSATVRQIGDQLMTRYVLALEVIGLLLTAALIGAVILAMNEKRPERGPE